jgi:hypothetical protein
LGFAAVAVSACATNLRHGPPRSTTSAIACSAHGSPTLRTGSVSVFANAVSSDVVRESAAARRNTATCSGGSGRPAVISASASDSHFSRCQ